MVCSLQKDGSPGDVIATLPLESLHSAALRELQRHPPEMEQNVTLQIWHCPCGEYHIQIVLIKPGIEGDILVPGRFGDPKIFVQFDGSAHHDHQIGGAGAGLFEISSHGLQLLDWGCLALPSCKDNIVAEVMGADLALRLYERYVNLCHQHQVSPRLLDRIQGDIKPLINHLKFQGRFRWLDLISILDRFHQKRSRIAPLSAAEYRPREANSVADYLAGQGSAYLLSLKQEQTQLPLEPVCLDVAPPYELLLKNHAVIAGFHAGGKFVLALLEMPSCAIDDIVRIMPLVEPRAQKQLSQILLATQKLTKPMVVEYVAGSGDGQGRVYARQVGAQQLPKDVRALVYGRTHKEVDMTGAHYEILRRISQSTSLPCVRPLRDRLRQVWSHAGVDQLEEEIKTRATLSEKVQDLINTNDSWEGSGVGPTRWSLPFYGGHIIRTHGSAACLHRAQHGPAILPVFVGPPCSDISGQASTTSPTQVQPAVAFAQRSQPGTCMQLCAICYSACCLGGTTHGLHACERHRRG